MPRMLPISEARLRLTELPKEFTREAEPDTVAVTRRGKPVLAIMPWDLYESLIETLEIMGDERLMASLRRSIREIRARKTYSTEEVRRRLRL